MEALKNNSQAIVRALTVAVAVVLQAITMVLVGFLGLCPVGNYKLFACVWSH